MAEQNETSGVARRDFLKTASVGGLAAGAAAVGLVPDAAAQSQNVPDGKKRRYQESEHVKAFYRTNRY